jgi:hypothetical protein
MVYAVSPIGALASDSGTMFAKLDTVGRLIIMCCTVCWMQQGVKLMNTRKTLHRGIILLLIAPILACGAPLSTPRPASPTSTPLSLPAQRDLSLVVLQSTDLPREYIESQRRSGVSEYEGVPLLSPLYESGPIDAYGVQFVANSSGHSIGNDIFIYRDEARAIEAFAPYRRDSDEPTSVGEETFIGSLTIGGSSPSETSYYVCIIWRYDNMISYLGSMGSAQIPTEVVVDLAQVIQTRMEGE